MVNALVDRVVYVVDDDKPSLDGLLMLLRADGLVARGFGSAEEVLEVIPDHERGCVITDVILPGMDGVELVQAIRSRGWRIPVIVVTGHADVNLAVKALKAGASDFLQKPVAPPDLLTTVREQLSSHEAQADLGDSRRQLQERLASLTTRERQVLELVVQGASNKVVAAKLKISPRTVEFYRANVMVKMQAQNLSDLIRKSLVAGAA